MEIKTQSYAQTQGYSNMYAEGKKVDNAHTNTITKVNDGAITQYPFRMGDMINSIAIHMDSIISWDSNRIVISII